MKKRLIYGVATLVIFLVEFLIARYVHDSFIRPYVGDVLVVILLYTFVRIFVPEKWPFLPLFIFIFAVGAELLQLINIVELLGLGSNRYLKIIMGSVFDISDIVCYGAGCVLMGAHEIMSRRT